MIIGARIDALLEEKGWSQAELARRIGVSQATIWKLVNGESRNSKYLVLIARALGTSPEYLLGHTDDPHPGDGWAELPPPREAGPDMSQVMMIRQIDLRFGAGATYLDHHVEENLGAFPRFWVRQFTDAPAEMLVWTRTKGNSMAPTINDGEPILIDMREKSIDDGDLIWAFAYGETGMVKRLRPHPDGSVEILSDNQNVPPARAVDGELHLVGRVVAVLKRV